MCCFNPLFNVSANIFRIRFVLGKCKACRHVSISHQLSRLNHTLQQNHMFPLKHVQQSILVFSTSHYGQILTDKKIMSTGLVLTKHFILITVFKAQCAVKSGPEVNFTQFLKESLKLKWQTSLCRLSGTVDLGLFCYWEGGMCVISWCSKWPRNLNAKPQKQFLPQRLNPPEQISHWECWPHW